MYAIDKMRKIVNWADWQNEGINMKFKSIEDIEKAYDYCQKKGIEFLDAVYLYDLDLEEDEVEQIMQEVNQMLGYQFFNLQTQQ